MDDRDVIKELLAQWEKNEKARKADEFQLINDTVNAMMLRQTQKIIDDQNQAWEKHERNIMKIRKRHDNVMKKLGGGGIINVLI